jgi:hypothetical protein
MDSAPANQRNPSLHVVWSLFRSERRYESDKCLVERHNPVESTPEPKQHGAAAAKQTGRFSLLEKSVKDTAHTSSYTTDLDYVTLETKSTVVR